MTATRLLAMLALAATAAACTPDPREQAAGTIRDGSALKAIQAHFDGHRQCATVLTGLVPIEISERGAELDSVRALVSAGLMVRSSLSSQPGEVRFTPAPEAAKWFQETRTSDSLPATLSLCYARRQVTRVWLDEGENPMLQYAYRLVDAPDWTRNADMVMAFPFLARGLSTELTADDRVPFRDGRWDASQATSATRIPGIYIDGFYACPPGHQTPPQGCK